MDFTPVLFYKVFPSIAPGIDNSFIFFQGDDTASYIEDDSKSQFDPEKTILGVSSPRDAKTPQQPEPAAHGRKPSAISMFFAQESAGQSPADTIKLSSTPALFQNAATGQRVSMSPIVVQPVVRVSSKTRGNSKAPSPSSTRPPNIDVGAALARQDSYVLPAISVSPMSYKHTRAESADERERPSRDRSTAPAEPAQAVVRSRSVPRQRGPGLPRRPSDGKSKPAGNYF